MEIETGIQDNDRQSLGGALYRLLSDMYSLYLKAQNFHWNVRGAHFYSLHKFFEEQYRDLAEAIDEVAERIRALGLFVEANFDAFRRLTSVAEEEKVLTSHDMIKHLLKDHETVCRHLRDLGTHADRCEDHATVDLVGRRLNVHEKFSWMLRSHID